MKRNLLLVITFLSLNLIAFGQRNVSDSIISTPWISVQYGLNWTAGDLKDRFGVLNHVGFFAGYKTKRNWIFGVDANFIFGNKIKIDRLFTNFVDSKGNIIDSNFRYHYYRDHYFDNIDFSDDGLVNTSVFGNKIEYFFGNKMLVQHWDTILKYAYRVIDQMDPKSKAFEYTVSYVTSNFGKSKQM